MPRLRLALLAALAVAPAAAADAQIGGPYNVLTFGSFSMTNTDAEGRVAAGGAFQATNFGIGSTVVAGSLPTAVAVAGGSMVLVNGQVNGGDAVYGGAGAAVSTGFPDGAFMMGTPLNFFALQTQQTALSGQLAGYATTGMTTVSSGAITLTGGKAGLNVFAVNGADLAVANGLTINVPVGATALVNVDGLLGQMQNFGFFLNGATASRNLFNFYQATTLTLAGIGVKGSILAPYAIAGVNNGHIDGDYVVNTSAGTLEFHTVSFDGSLTAVPEPATVALLGGGLLALGAVARRRRG